MREFADRFSESAEPSDTWYRIASKATWQNLSEVRLDYPHADPVGTCTVFNLGGNKFRLIVKINYVTQMIFIKHVLTHQEYDKDKWKNDC